MKLSFFDCNCMIGKRSDRRSGEPWSLHSLLEDMEFHGIDEALVVHALSRDYHPAVGNQEIINITQDYGDIHPVWALLPPATQELPPPSQFIGELLSEHVKATIAYPKLHNYSLADWSMGKIFAELDCHRIPLLLPLDQTSWQEVRAICRQYAHLPVIVTTFNYRQLRFLLPLWMECPNLYADISWFSVFQGLSFVIRQVGVKRLLFGSHYPVYTPAGAVAMVTYADVDPEHRRSIAGDTLRELISEIRIR